MIWDSRMYMLVDQIFVALLVLGMLGFTDRPAVPLGDLRVRRAILAGDVNEGRLPMRKLLSVLLAALSMGTLDANAQLVKMTIATGVDPAFSQFYVAKEAGIFEKNGLDVTINTGPSGSAMVPFLINNQVQAAYGSDLAGVINHQVDNNVVAVADGTYLLKWLSVVGRNVATLDEPQGQEGRHRQGHRQRDLLEPSAREAEPQGWPTTPSSNVEAPEMLAAIERGDIDGFAVWEPWPTRTLHVGQGHQGPADRRGHLQQHQLRLHEPRLDRAEQGHR